MDNSNLPQQVTCPDCGRVNKPDAPKCWWCGHLLAVDPSQQPTMPNSVPGQGLSQYTQPTQRISPAQPHEGPQYSDTRYQASQAPTQRVPQPPPLPPAYSPPGQYAQPDTQAAAAQVNVSRRRPTWWLWAVLAVLAMGLCAVLVAALPGLPQILPTQATATPQPGVVAATATATPTAAPSAAPSAAVTDTPAPATLPPTETATAPPADTPTEIVVPTVTPVPTDTPEPAPTDTPEAAPTDTPVAPPPTPEPTGTYSASASANPRQPNMPNGVVYISGTLLRDGQPVEGAAVRIVAHFPKIDSVLEAPPTGPDGSSTAALKIPNSARGSEIETEVIFLVGGQEVAHATTSFAPR